VQNIITAILKARALQRRWKPGFEMHLFGINIFVNYFALLEMKYLHKVICVMVVQSVQKLEVGGHI